MKPSIRTRELVLLPLALLAATFGCASMPGAYRAVSGGPGGPEGSEMASYPLQLGGQRLGKVQVSSPGMVKRDSGGQEPLVLIELQVKNKSQGAITLDRENCALELELENGIRMVQPPREMAGETIAEPGRTSRTQLVFTLPPGATPDNVVAYELNWAVKAEGKRIARTTVFARGAPRPGPCADPTGGCRDAQVVWIQSWPVYYPHAYVWAPYRYHPFRHSRHHHFIH